MRLFINLGKGMNFGKLVKRPVQVKGKNGKVFTRMQWVNPMDVSDGMGMRKISTKQGWEQAKKDGIHRHPDYAGSLKDQGVHEDTFEDHHPHFFVPETEESYNNRKDRERSQGFFDIQDDLDHSRTFDHGEEISSHAHKIYGEHHFVSTIPLANSEDYEKFLKKHNVHPEIHGVMKKLDEIEFSDGDSTYGKISQLSEEINDVHWGIVKSHIEDHIKDTVKDTFVRSVQLNAFREGNVRHGLSVALHPVIARHTVNKVLGESLANKFRKDLDMANLSVNFPTYALDGIKKGGYVASTMEKYIKENMGEEAWEHIENLMEQDFPSESHRIEEIQDLPDHSWYEVYTRAHAEYEAVGLHLEDRKPTYIAMNPLNDERGAATYYGSRWLKVTDVDHVLNHSTATFDDSFNDTRAIPKIWDMDHLKDIFILKMANTGSVVDDMVRGTDPGVDWHLLKGDIPIELQYHEPMLKPDQFEIQRDHMEKYSEPDLSGLESGEDLGMDEDEFNELYDELFSDDPDDIDVGDTSGGDDDIDLDDLEDLDLVDDSNVSWDDLFDDLENKPFELDTDNLDNNNFLDKQGNIDHSKISKLFDYLGIDETTDEGYDKAGDLEDHILAGVDVSDWVRNNIDKDIYLKKDSSLHPEVGKSLDVTELTDNHSYAPMASINGKLYEGGNERGWSHSELTQSVSHDIMKEQYEKSDKSQDYEDYYWDNRDSLDSLEPIYGRRYQDREGNDFYTVHSLQDDDATRKMAKDMHEKYGKPTYIEDNDEPDRLIRAH